MPELPEVEVVRRGLERYVVGRTVRSVQVFHPRAVRRHAAGPGDFVAALRGVTIAGARRRGKYLWLPVIASGKTPGAVGESLAQPAGPPSPGQGAAIEANPRQTGTEVSLEDLAVTAGVSLEDLEAGAEVSLEDLAATAGVSPEGLEAGAEVSLEELGTGEDAAPGSPGGGSFRGPHENELALSRDRSPAASRDEGRAASRDEGRAASRDEGRAALRPDARSYGLSASAAADTPASAAEDAMLAHLGMSGQLVLGDPDRPLSPHVRVRFTFTDSGPDLRFTDQRTFGHLLFAPGGASLPGPISHIAPDPMEPAFDQAAFIAKLRTRRTGIKTALLDQSLVSGIGNIYADEALWRAKMHWARPAASLSRADAARLLSAVREVMTDALAAGGTSFDSLYVNVNGESGYFGRSLAVYGREDQPCLRCGTPIRRDPFMNRSAYSCPVCQRRPRSRSGARDLRRRST